jgi:branched-chain amino acid transport system permease protein
MTDFFTFTIVGLSTASILAIAASGLVVTYQTSGIFNFAHGAVGMLAAFAYWQVHFDWGWPTLIALATVLLVLAPLLGAAIERFVMRGLVGTREVTRIVVPVSLLVAMVGLATWVWPPEARPFPPFFDGEKVRVGDVFVTYHQLLTAVFAVVVAVGLRIILHRLRAGVTMRAVVDDRNLIQLNAGDPDRSAMLAWILGSQLAALAGILVATSIRLSAIGLTLLVVNAYAAAVVGRLKSLPMTFVGAVILGLLDAYATGYLPTDNDYLAAFRLAIPSLFLFVALVLVPHARLRGHAVQRAREVTQPTGVRKASIAAIVFVAVVVVVSGILDRSDQVDLGVALGVGIVALSLVPLVGFAGQISLCQMSFAAVGAMMMAQFGGDGSLWGLLLAVVVTAAVGALVALPAIRLQGLYLALATGAFAVFLDRWVFTLRGVDLWGLHLDLFAGGTLTVPRLDVPGVSFDDERASAILLGVVFAALGVFVVWIRQSRFGRRLIALRTSPAAAATLGVRVTRTRFAVFALSAGMAGLGGALLAGVRSGSSAEQFSFVESLVLLLMAVAGGISLVSGALFAGLSALLFKWLGETFSALENAVLLLPGVVGMALGRNPNGVVSQIAEGFAPLKKDATASTGVGIVVALLLGARYVDLIPTWSLVVVSLVALAVGTVLAARRARVDDELGREPLARGIPLERLGIDTAWTDDDVRELDMALGLER